MVNLFLLTNESAAWFNRLCAQCCTQHLAHMGNYFQLFPRSILLHIGIMCSRRSLNGLILSAYTRFHPSCCWIKVAPPVPLCNSPFHIHSRLLCHEHYLSLCHQNLNSCISNLRMCSLLGFICRPWFPYMVPYGRRTDCGLKYLLVEDTGSGSFPLPWNFLVFTP